MEQASSRASRRVPYRAGVRVMRIAGSAVLVLFLVFQLVNPRRPVTANTPGFRDPVAGFELASSPDDVLGILGAPGDARRAETVHAMRRGLHLDFVFLIAYPTFYVGLALATRGALGRALPAVLALAIVMLAGDALENVQLLHLTETVDPAAMVDPLGRLRVFTLAKWYALFAASALVAPALWRYGGAWRSSALLFALAAAVGFASVAAPPAIEWAIVPLGIAWTVAWIAALASRPHASPP